MAARLLSGLRPVTVRKWAQLGQLERRGVDTKRRTLYRFADIEALWARSCAHADATIAAYFSLALTDPD